MFLEGVLFVSCFLVAGLIAIITGRIKKASQLLYGFLLLWFIVFYLGIPGIRVYLLRDEGAESSFADMPAPLIFFVLAAIYCLLFATICATIRWLFQRARTSRRAKSNGTPNSPVK